ncbi:MAG: hypothetical protein ABFE01_10665 [Phycisphaerales bacterium]
MAGVHAILALARFLGFSIHTRWYRIFAFPFRPPRDLALRGRKELLVAALCFGGGTLFWAFLAGLTITVLTAIYERQGYGFDIPFLALMAVFMMFSLIAAFTALYLLVRTAFWRQRSFVEIHGRRYEPAEVYARVVSCEGRTWRPEPWTPAGVLAMDRGIVGLAHAGVGQTHDPGQVERIGRPGLDYAYCTLCGWLLCRSDDAERGQGYTDGEAWLCKDCFERLVKPVQDRRGPDS